MCVRQNQWANEGSVMPLTHSLVPQGRMGRERRGRDEDGLHQLPFHLN